MAWILRNDLFRRLANMEEMFKIFWIVIVFWLLIEVISNKILKSKKSSKLNDNIDINDKNK